MTAVNTITINTTNTTTNTGNSHLVTIFFEQIHHLLNSAHLRNKELKFWKM